MHQLRHDLELAREPRGLRELIPVYLRAGILRRVEDFGGGILFIEVQTDRGILFIEVQTDRIFARIDPWGRLAGAVDEA
jgi:hypothetical protein